MQNSDNFASHFELNSELKWKNNVCKGQTQIAM